MSPEHDPLDVAARIDELKLLTDGWLDGRGTASGPGGLDWARELVDALNFSEPEAISWVVTRLEKLQHET